MTIDISGATVSGTHIAVNTTTATATGLLTNVSEYAALDYGVGYFTSNWSLTGEFNVTAISANGIFQFGVSDQLAAWVVGSGTDNALAGQIVGINGTQFQTGLRQKVAGTQVSVQVAAALTLATTYYYSLYHISGLGRYGGMLLQTYSNISRTTIVTQIVYACTAPTSARYLHVMQSVNNTAANTISGTNANFTLGTLPVGRDLTTYTTSGAALASYADSCVITALTSNTTQYVYKDDGVNYWSRNYEQKSAINVTAYPAGSSAKMAILSVSDSAAVEASTLSGAVHAQYVLVSYASSTTATLKLCDRNATVETLSASSITLTLNKPLWLKKRRDTTVGTFGTIYLQAYSDPNYTVPFGIEISLALTENINYRYSYAVQSYNNLTAGSITGSVGGFTAIILGASGSIVGSGGFVLGGSSPFAKSGSIVGAGGFVLGGSSATKRTRAWVGSGGFVLGGSSATLGSNSGSGSAVGSGGFVLGGSAATRKSASIVGSGGFVLGGSSSFVLPTNFEEIKFVLYDASGNAITGATVTCLLRKDITGTLTALGTMTEIDPSHTLGIDGYYKLNIDIAQLSDGKYTIFCDYAGTPKQHGSVEFSVRSGKIIDQFTANQSAMTVSQTDTLEASMAALPTAAENAAAVWAKAVEGLTAEEIMRVMLAALAGKRQGIGTSTEQYLAQDGITPRISLTPTDSSGNGAPIINGAP